VADDGRFGFSVTRRFSAAIQFSRLSGVVSAT